jgi:DNA-directed RNA polymerase beta subunit
MALEPLEERWLLQDYGTMQCLRDVLTNESIRVFGPSASVDGGPWELTSVDGKAILRSEKDDGSEEFAIPSELSRFRLSLDSSG